MPDFEYIVGFASNEVVCLVLGRTTVLQGPNNESGRVSVRDVCPVVSVATNLMHVRF